MADREPIRYTGPPTDTRITSSPLRTSDSPNPTVRKLSSLGAVNFDFLSRSVNPDALDTQTLTDLREATGSHVVSALFRGQWRDLRGAKEFMDKVGVTVELPDTVYKRIDELLPRIPQETLISLGLSQPSVAGEYNVAGAKKILSGIGFTEEELSDNAVVEVLNLRHILSKLHENKMKKGDELKEAMPRILTRGTLALNPGED